MTTPVTPEEKREIVERWARERLRAETRARRGRAAEIARAIDVSTAHIANVTSEPPSRGIGQQMLDKLAALWGFASYSELEVAALRESGHDVPLAAPERFVELDPRYPNLAITIEWLRGQMPDDFLRDFAKTALKSDADMSREDWYHEAKSAYARWRGKALPERPPPDEDDDPIAEKMAAARKKIAAKKRGGK